MPVSAAAPPAYRWDNDGDPLPPGAVARLGSVRWRPSAGSSKPIFSHDGRWLASVDRNKGLYLWEVATGQVRHFPNGVLIGSPRFYHFAFCRDGRSIISMSLSGRNIWRLEVPSGKLLQRWKGYGNEVAAVATGPGDRLIAIGEKQGRVRLLDLRSG
jgi:WD40 repeat protein